MAARRLPLKSDYRFYFHQDKGRSTSVDKDVFSPHLDRVAIDSHGRVLLHLPGRDVVFPAMPGASHDGSVQDSLAERPGSPERNHRDLPLAWLGIRRHDREGEAEPGRGSRLLPGRGAGRRHLCRRWLICPYLDENKSDSLISKEAVALPSFHSEATLSRVDAYIFVSLFKHHRV